MTPRPIRDPRGGNVPRSFRRESRLFLWVALLLILFVNLVTLRLLASATAGGSGEAERRAAEILRRLSSSQAASESIERAAAESDVVFIAFYDGSGRRQRGSGRDFEPPAELPAARPAAGSIVNEWKSQPPLLVSVTAARGGFYAVGLDPGQGRSLRTWSRRLQVLVPLAGAVLVVLAGLYLRSLL